MNAIVGNAAGVAGAVGGPMLAVYWWFPRRLRFARRFFVSVTGLSMIGLLVWIYIRR
jgi:hypothetical protein